MSAEQDSMVSDILQGKIRASMTFQQKVWALTARIPAGKVATYGQIAAKLQSNAFRAVGGALHNNPFAPKVPCHRVVGSNGRLTGFAHGLPAKEKLLLAEGVPVVKGRVDLTRHQVRL